MQSGLMGRCIRVYKLFWAEFSVWCTRSLPFTHSSSYRSVNTPSPLTVLALSIKRNIQAYSHSHCCCMEVKSNHIFRVCVFSLMLSSVTCPTVSYFYHTNKRHYFRKKFTIHKMCDLIFSTNFVWNISHSKKNSGIFYHKYIEGAARNVPVFFQILMDFDFSLQIFEKPSNQFSWKSIQWELSCSMQMDRPTDQDEAYFRLPEIWNFPKKLTS